ncbi:MAG: ubiquinone biosynthesis monooxygenase Coq7 [Kiritimatiellia bacterium]
MNTLRHLSLFDRIITEGDKVLRTLATGNKASGNPSPAKNNSESSLNDSERQHAAGLMRINHTGEVCAQALYQGQSLTAKLPHIRQEMEQAAKEEVDHLNWCDERLQQLNSRSSLLNPFFYGLSFSMGALAGAISDKVSLGFVAATEEQVCQHLEKHLQELPLSDTKSRAIIEEMLKDEARHQQTALDAGGSEFPLPIKLGMKLMSKVMTKTTYYI